MAEHTAIEWTDATWNPVIGCTRVSEGCRNCYAERNSIRIAGPGKRYERLVKTTPAGPRWTGEVRFVEEALELPLRWRAPRRIFVNSMSDLFHEKVEDEWIDAIWGVMMLAERHTFQILTKRPERMRSYLAKLDVKRVVLAAVERWAGVRGIPAAGSLGGAHIWLGVSVEDQATADERIPLLLQTPAAVRWVSYEPALGSVDFRPWLPIEEIGGVELEPWLDWIVIGGESGPGARPFDLAWARSAIAQCRASGVPVFVKQLGAKVRITGDAQDAVGDRIGAYRWERMKEYDGDWRIILRDRKGGDMAEWPEALRVREYPG